MDLFIILLTFTSVIVAVVLIGISRQLDKIAALLREHLEKNSSLDQRLLQANGSLIEIAALLQAQRRQP
ncbi:MAG: hypothetical protein LV480_13175 [Methylacidiphilales bacterium]|nr:hypothetical protein [Candidatus Methylacidiphilales bacterium]